MWGKPTRSIIAMIYSPLLSLFCIQAKRAGCTEGVDIGVADEAEDGVGVEGEEGEEEDG